MRIKLPLIWKQRTIKEYVVKRMIIFLTGLFLFLLYTNSFSQKHPSQLKFNPLTFSVPDMERVVLTNGIVVYMLEDNELPIIEGSAMIRTGSIYEAPGKTGLAKLTGIVMRTGGTESMGGDEIDEALEFIAAKVETGIDDESGSALLSVLKKEFDKALGIFADVLMNPVFSGDKIDLAKRQELEKIRRRNDRPASILDREFGFLMYGKDSPFARVSTAETINGITRDDLIEFHKKYFCPDNIILGFSGDFDSNELIEKLENVFGKWKERHVSFSKVSNVREEPKKSVNYIYKDINQSNIAIGHLGIKRHNPDYFSVVVLNQILSFQKLFYKVRTDEGLAYSVRSRFTVPTYRGIFKTVMQTKQESTVRAIELVQQIIEEIRKTAVSGEELKTAKNTYLNSFVFNFEQTERIVKQRMKLEYFDYPADYLNTFRDNVAKVTKKDIRRAAKKYLKPDKFVILVVGNDKGFDKPLSLLGKVREIIIEE